VHQLEIKVVNIIDARCNMKFNHEAMMYVFTG